MRYCAAHLKHISSHKRLTIFFKNITRKQKIRDVVVLEYHSGQT